MSTPPSQRPSRPGGPAAILTLVVLIAGSSIVASCSRPKADHQGSLTSADTLVNGLPGDVVPVLAPWIAMWREAIPDFKADSLRAVGRSPALRGGHVQPMSDFDSLSPGEAAAFRALTARSTGGRYRLIFDHYQTISEEDGEVDVSGEPDSSPLLIDEHLRTAHIFEFCGTPCGYDWGGWVDSVRFALGGWAEIDSGQDSLRGVLGIYSLLDSTEARYFTRPVSGEEYARYREAWRGWVKAQYRSQQAHAANRGH